MSALSGIDIALWDLKARRLNIPIYQLLGGAVRERVAVYAWIGGDRPNDIAAAATARKAQGFRAVKMNATEDIGWLDSPEALKASVERLKTVKALGMDAGVDFHGRLHKPMAKQLVKALEPYGPLFVEEPLLSEHPEGVKQISEGTTVPIALGERLYSRWDFKRFFEGGFTSHFLLRDTDVLMIIVQMGLSISFSPTSRIVAGSPRSDGSQQWLRRTMVSDPA